MRSAHDRASSGAPDVPGGTPAPRPTLNALARAALVLGATGFGGGVSVLAAIQQAVVRRRWLTEKEFTNVATIAQMLPGGAAANALACIGLRFRGVAGAAVAYVGFALPGALSIVLLAWVYVRFGAVPQADVFLAGLNAAVVGVVIAIAVRMLRAGVTRLWQMSVAAGALFLTLVGRAGSGEVVLAGVAAGLVWDLGVQRGAIAPLRRRRSRPSPPVALPDEGAPLVPAEPRAPSPHDRAPRDATLRVFAAAVIAPALLLLGDLLPLAAVFFRTGLGAYGGGFSVIPSLSADVQLHGWMTERQFADAVAVGKLTPGPVLLMATFIGYVRQGLLGAVVSTVAILAAPFGLVVALSTWLDRARSRRWVRAALRGLTPAVVGLMTAAAITLGGSIASGAEMAIAAAVALTLARFDRVNPVYLLGLGGATRVAIRLLTGA